LILAQEENMQPTIGRIVHYYANGMGPVAAIVTAVHGDECVSLCAFPFGEAPRAATSIVYAASPGDAAGACWTWPPRV
jgi:hypothetical protein